MPIDFTGWLRESYGYVVDNPVRGSLKAMYRIYLAAYLSFQSQLPMGRNIYESDWDVLVVLDACRVDALRELADEYDYINEVDAVWSRGSSSLEWLCGTFTPRHLSAIRNTIYLTANPYPKLVFEEGVHPPFRMNIPFGFCDYQTVNASDFRELDLLFSYCADDQVGVVPPDIVTDRAITLGRARNVDRFIVHYMQPHEPYIGGEKGVRFDIFSRLMEGELSLEEVKSSYLTHLRQTLDYVDILVKNLEADRMVITADHGEAFGEMGFYGHTTGSLHPVVRKVPWVVTGATDTGMHEPQEILTEADERGIGDHLEALGYL